MDRGVGGWGLANTVFNWSKPGVCMDVYDNVQYEKPLKALDQSTTYTASFCRDIAMILEKAPLSNIHSFYPLKYHWLANTDG